MVAVQVGEEDAGDGLLQDARTVEVVECVAASVKEQALTGGLYERGLAAPLRCEFRASGAEQRDDNLSRLDRGLCCAWQHSKHCKGRDEQDR